jgi:ligand-binding SRPBCC domain-containing protein
MAPEHVYEATQHIPRPIPEVFAFFSDEANLERLTPPWLGFRVLGKSTPEIGAGTLIDYRLSLSGLPLKWRTLIEVWEPGKRFVDTQLKGPYKKWHHTHTFEAEGEGTRMRDRVVYQLPLGRLGDLVALWKVRRQVQEIFAYRTQVIREIFG